MPITVASLGQTVYVVGANQIITDVLPLRGEHKKYTTAAARINVAWNPDQENANVLHFQGIANAGGTAIYLPYNDDKITSVCLPVPPPAGVDLFLTANMSGCKFFVDTIGGSHDLIVYHANTHQFGAPPHNSPANTQSGAAAGILDNLHTHAQGDYAPLALHNVADLDKPTYYLAGALEELRKSSQGRTLTVMAGSVVTPEFMGGCTIVGLFQVGSWHFYYQTWGDVNYDRPTGFKVTAKKLLTGHWHYVHKARVEGSRHQVSYSTMKVLDYRLFHS